MHNSGDWESFDTSLVAACEAMGVQVDASARRQMFAHYELLCEANRKFNLTRIATPADAAVKHYADSLSVLAMPDLLESLSVLDVGTGGGFPALPLAILRPGWAVTAIDGTGKKARFVAEAAEALSLTNVEAIHARAADLARDKATAWDLVLLRAVTQLAPGLKEVHRLVHVGGRIVFYKTASTDSAEIGEGQAAAKRYGLVAEDGIELTLPSPEGPLSRRLVVYRRER